MIIKAKLAIKISMRNNAVFVLVVAETNKHHILWSGAYPAAILLEDCFFSKITMALSLFLAINILT